MAEQLLNAAAAAPPAEPVKHKAAEPAPIPTKAGKVGSIPAGQKGSKKGEAPEVHAASHGETLVSEHVVDEAVESPVQEPPVDDVAEDAPLPVDEPPEEDRPTEAPAPRRAPQPSG